MKNNLKAKFKKYKLINILYYKIYAPLRQTILNRNRRIYKNNYSIFSNANGIEIGGPSDIFKKTGPIPIYELVANIDNINFSDKTFWGDISSGNNFKYNDQKQNGKQFITDATDLSMIGDNTYDFLLTSHVLEHIANPIKALYEWKRVIKKEGHLLIILPSMNHTFDWKRKLTELSHIIDDYKNNMQENDETHFEEIIKMHDVEKDTTVSSYEEHVRRTKNNYSSRIVHHHTFNMNLLKSLLEYCTFEIIDAQFIAPYNLVVIAKKV
jgi:SAM-dependent methyltransferase